MNGVAELRNPVVSLGLLRVLHFRDFKGLACQLFAKVQYYTRAIPSNNTLEGERCRNADLRTAMCDASYEYFGPAHPRGARVV